MIPNNPLLIVQSLPIFISKAYRKHRAFKSSAPLTVINDSRVVLDVPLTLSRPNMHFFKKVLCCIRFYLYFAVQSTFNSLYTI